AELDQQGAIVENLLGTVRGRYVSDAAREHDGLVVTAPGAADRLLEGPEIPSEARPAEFVVERRGADRPVLHDLQRRNNPAWAAEVLLPGPRHARHVQ